MLLWWLVFTDQWTQTLNFKHDEYFNFWSRKATELSIWQTNPYSTMINPPTLSQIQSNPYICYNLIQILVKVKLFTLRNNLFMLHPRHNSLLHVNSWIWTVKKKLYDIIYKPPKHICVYNFIYPVLRNYIYLCD